MKIKGLCVLLVVLTGCFGSLKKPDGVDKDYLNKQKQAEKVKAEIKKNEELVSSKGATIVHGAGHALSLETNKTPEIQVASELISYAKLTLDVVSVAEAKKIEDIVEGLIKEVRAENIKLKIQNTTSKVEMDILRGQLKLVESEGSSARRKMDAFQGEITRLQNNEESLKKKYEAELSKLNDENLDNAAKASAWDESHTLLASLNPFTDIVSFFKKLFTLSVICGVLFIAFKVLEVFFPAFSILSGIFGMIINVIKKIVPKAFAFSGLVSSKVYDTLAQVIQSNQTFLKDLETLPLEDELIEKYPENHSFTKKEVKEILLALTDKTMSELRKNLDKNTTNETRGIISYVKADKGIKEEKPVVSLI